MAICMYKWPYTDHMGNKLIRYFVTGTCMSSIVIFHFNINEAKHFDVIFQLQSEGKNTYFIIPQKY